MITNIVYRYAENISSPNEIANFDARYSIKGPGISAVSWEIESQTRREGSEALLKVMLKKLLPCHEIEKITLRVIVELSATQPDNAVVNHKKLWGLLKDRGIQTEDILDKVNFIRKGMDGLILSGIGTINLAKKGLINSLINIEKNVYFSIDENKKNTIHYEMDKSNWMNETWKNGGIIFFPLGFFDEPSCEVVAMGNKKDIMYLTD
ncbi:hypothetical protein AAGR22_08030 [Erwinia sp. HDF1-3R]|uniref:hypothetical protein n=1 Tax=Erwinia sp. HDF1-3R TaxID=3141543 RepID=UPI0031F4A873